MLVLRAAKVAATPHLDGFDRAPLNTGHRAGMANLDNDTEQRVLHLSGCVWWWLL